MESKQLEYNTATRVLTRIDTWYKKNADAKNNEYRFGVKSKVCWLKYKIVVAVERIIKTDLECDRKLTSEDFENFKKYI